MSRSALLRQAFTHVPSHGFTRRALALSAPEELSDSAVTALFGRGEEAEKTLFQAWLDEGRQDMRGALSEDAKGGEKEKLYALLARRLRYNEPALKHLPDAFALLSSPSFASSLPIPLTLPRFRLLPGLKHVSSVADEACWLLAPSSGSQSTTPTYYLDRTRVAAVYAAAELHQLSAPGRSERFLRDLLEGTGALPQVVGEMGMFAEYVGRSWAGIIRSRGM
ncbi:hypothetical protein CALVIDRAFT_540163 [Calocera viscosa TUFC12733]|uniref:COQ9 domain-containing protein n=1 Tax=Calocera viscosa (strain TUFC12733) TaxID=1330018 RepID=A0A167J2D8_CALVF|nr:hypothetical protein CALVIDRAFT_540163 [Calocera viscosa TUFC12733]